MRLALGQPRNSDESLKEWALLLYNTARYAWLKGSFHDVETMSVMSMEIRKKLLGQDDKDTLSGPAMVALACNLGGRLDRAEELEVEVMERMKRVLGHYHPDTLASMNNLAWT